MGKAWLRHTCGVCKYASGVAARTFCLQSCHWLGRRRIRRIHDGSQAFAQIICRAASGSELAPLLCAGIIGYRRCCAPSYHPVAG